jgi:hypothetical protein
MNANVKIAYDVYRGKTDPSLRLATAPGARLPAHVRAKDWVLMSSGSSPLHSDAPNGVLWLTLYERAMSVSTSPASRDRLPLLSDGW